MVGMGNERDVDIAYIDDRPREDGAVVVQIDTGERTGRLRVTLNELTIWDGNPEEDGAALANLVAQGRSLILSTTTMDTLDAVTTRTANAFTMFYDDDESAPDQAIRDALTDLMHVAADRGVDFEVALQLASNMWTQEREEWDLDD